MDLRYSFRLPEVAALAAKDAVHFARHGFRKAGGRLPGRRFIDRLPGSSLAYSVGNEVGDAALGAVGSLRQAVHRLLDRDSVETNLRVLPLRKLLQHRRSGGSIFADAAYAALKHALRRQGAQGGLIVELALRRAFHDAKRKALPTTPTTRIVAELGMAMLHRDVIIDVIGDDLEVLKPDLIVQSIVSFCLVLAVAERQELNGELPVDLLEACCDLCRALDGEVQAASKTTAGLSAFLQRYGPHV